MAAALCTTLFANTLLPNRTTNNTSTRVVSYPSPIRNLSFPVIANHLNEVTRFSPRQSRFVASAVSGQNFYFLFLILGFYSCLPHNDCVFGFQENGRKLSSLCLLFQLLYLNTVLSFIFTETKQRMMEFQLNKKGQGDLSFLFVRIICGFEQVLNLRCPMMKMQHIYWTQ